MGFAVLNPSSKEKPDAISYTSKAAPISGTSTL